ncbi:MAG: S24 family peptidase [Pseudomonadota bacterium]|nr:S24 family peptidase [Pseudomonadota bacterium]
MDEAGARAALARLIEEQRADYAGLSRLIGRNPAYIQQYIRRGTPRRLAERDRRLLARYFGVAEELLGGPAASADDRDDPMVRVARLDVGASAGAGALDPHERPRGHFAFDPAWLRRIAGDPKRLSMIRVEGDSMAPTLADGDEILVDRGAGAERLRDGIYVLRIDEALVVKRVAPNPAGRTVSIRSDNPAYPDWPDCDPAAVEIVGRVVWAGRRIA